MPSDKRKCPCPNCIGKPLVDPRTYRKHEAQMKLQQNRYAVLADPELTDDPGQVNDSDDNGQSVDGSTGSPPRKRHKISNLINDAELWDNESSTGAAGMEDNMSRHYTPPRSSPPQHYSDHDISISSSPRDAASIFETDDEFEFNELIQDAMDEEEELVEARLAAASLGVTLDDADSDEDPVHTSGEAEEVPDVPSRIESIRSTQSMVDEIKRATLDNGKLPPEVIKRLRDPSTTPLDPFTPDEHLSIDLYSACSNASEATYNAVSAAVQRRFRECNVLSLHSVKKLIADTSGVVSVLDDMCINSCHAFVGPYVDLTACSICHEPRYTSVHVGRREKQVSRQSACTIPLGPQIQALRRSPQNAAAMRYRDTKLKEVLETIDELMSDDDMLYDDIWCGSDLIKLSDELDLSANDTTVMFSIDGAQIYQSKHSDTWIGIWIITDYNPKTRYRTKHILPALIIPGPNKPKNIDSFMFRTFHHLSAIQKENQGDGLRVWDAYTQGIILSRVVFILGTADAMGLTELDGRVGHHGAQGCRLGCDFKGRHKPGSGHYYSAHLRPLDNPVVDCDHPDFDFRNMREASIDTYQQNLRLVLQSRNQGQYEKNRLATGISKPSLLSGLRYMIPLPRCFSVDLMHLFCLNMADLLIPLWRGDKKMCSANDNVAVWDWAVLKGAVWEEFGDRVVAATKYFPSSFHRPPRNPVEKISSGYKSTEFYLLLYGLCPAFLRTILSEKYWRNFCKLVRGVRIAMQHHITLAQVKDARTYLVQFVEEFENIYYQRRMDRLQFTRPVLHSTLHVPLEVPRVGNGSLVSQYTMERMVGDLGRGIRQPSNPFANLCHLALRKSQMNALKIICPELDHTSKPLLPRYSVDLGEGFVLLRPRDRHAVGFEGDVHNVIISSQQCHQTRYQRWGRVRLPNRQIARSLYSETQRPSKRQENSRVTRNVKLILDGKVEYGEIQFYLLDEETLVATRPNPSPVPLALVLLYKPRDPDIYAHSYETLWACRRGDAEDYHVVPISSIVAVVSMQPLPSFPEEPNDLWFVIEKSGLEDLEVLSSESLDDLFDF